MSRGNIKYEPLSIEDGGKPELEDFSKDTTHSNGRRPRLLFIGVILAQAAFNVSLLGIDWFYHPRELYGPPKSPHLIYSPLQDAVEYRVVRFNDSLGGHETEYMGVGDAVDKRWEALFQWGMVQIPKEQARLLAEPTSPIPGDEDNYVISVEVFHQLHCLNMFRKKLHPEHYPPPPPNPPPQEHTDHCIDILRQSVMCTVDMNPMGWRWDEEKQINLPRLTGAHTCRDFDKITAWASEHRMTKEYDRTVHVPSDLWD